MKIPPAIRCKRVYDPREASDGYCVLVDRIWPRNFKKENFPQGDWLKELAPSTELRKWFDHDPERWSVFCQRYHAELGEKEEATRALLEACDGRPLTLLYAARDTRHNNAVALQMYLEACYGFLTREEVIDLLSTLLHAERAGVRVCHLSRRDAITEGHSQLLRDIFKDEANSCRGLIMSLKYLGVESDHTVGDFADKCLAISEFDKRLQFLNRGQGWVAKRIAEALPRIQDEPVRRQLADMLADHRRNIDLVNVVLNKGS